MWKRHPLIRFAIALSVAALLVTALFLTGLLDPNLWADAQARPHQLTGTLQNLKPATYARPGRFELVGADSSSQSFEINGYISTNALHAGQQVEVSFSPHLKHVYAVQILSEDDNVFEQDRFEQGALFQPFQTPAVVALLLVSLLLLGAASFALLALTDWLIKPRQLLGAVQTRLEQSEFNAGRGIVVRPLLPNRKSQRFWLNQHHFLQTDGAEFVQVAHTPLFNYVKRVQVVAAAELPLSLRNVQPTSLPTQPALLHYLSRWQFAFFLYADLAGAIVLFCVPLIVVIAVLPIWFEPPTSHYRLYGILLPSIAMLALIMAVFLIKNFWHKWRDVRRPKKLTEGPVLSKWRVNGVSNENRRQIVVADGGLAGGSEAVHKFDISAQIFDELAIGDVVKIEHTPHLRFILRLEIIGHQELMLGNPL